MRGRNKRLSSLAVMAVVATALLGAVYTMWFEDVKVQTNFTTSNLDGRIYCGTYGDNDGIDLNGNILVTIPPDFPPAIIDGYPAPVPDKDIGHVIGLPNGDHEFNVTVTNAYPGYAIDCEVELKNIGVVPWHIETETVEVYVNGVLQDFANDLQCDGLICSLGDISPTSVGPTHDPLWVGLRDMRGCQIHPNTPAFAASTSLHIGVNQSALETTTYQIVVKFRLNQWNESAWVGCGQPRPT